ncbi:MAG: transcription-repair coupling factor [Clostridiales bacterium]|nr:transcription-repair coupling factor [Clostridiales bacterium]
MFKKFLSNGNFLNLINSVEAGENISVFGLNLGEKLAIVKDTAFLFFVCDNGDNVFEVEEKLTALGRKCDILTDTINVFTDEFTSFEKILKTLYKIKNNEIDTLIVIPEIICQRYPDISNIDNIQLKVGCEDNIVNIGKRLTQLNYRRVDLVSQMGEYSIKGDVVDIFPLSGVPTRVYFDYDTISNIKEYNPVTMLTSQDIDEICIYPNKYCSVSKEKIDEFFSSKKLSFDEIYDNLIELKNNDYRLIAFDNFKSSIFDFVQDATIVFDGARNIYNKLDDYVKNFKQKIKDLKKPLSVVLGNEYIDLGKVLKFNHQLIAFHFINEGNRIFKPNKVFNIRTLAPVNYVGYNDVLLLDVNNFKKLGYTVILASGTNENAIRIKNLFDEKNVPNSICSVFSLCQKGEVNILSRNFPLDIIVSEEKLAIISTSSLFGRKKKIKQVEAGFFDGEVPSEGDFVVHNFHGVGKCLGVKTMQISSSFRDYVVVEYKNNDKLYLPVENLNQLSKYLSTDKQPVLNKIGGVEFAKTKSKVKSSVKKVAFDLIALYRERLNLKGIKYLPDDDMQVAFENQFGFDETADQLSAINDCKQDMQSGKLMDRLICGDVGFGKTEVALRIAFKTILGGKQVALLCPTTILSEQHFITAKNRMSNFGVKIEVLNRLKSPKEIEKIKKDFKDGKIDFLIGTHKLLAKDIDYKNLGLLIIDEEQKFGVGDKEKIKNFKKQINVLTLSATPIPRTINMSLIGVRDISVIETPPVERRQSIVEVLEFNDNIIKSAIEKELSRKGQVLVIYNRVETIYKFASYIHSLVGNANISVAHGQMNESELESEIFKLYSGETEILVSTTLIENGVDLPNANTLIVINSDLLGLSQLYQLKGRVGRGDRQSFAYFTFDSRKLLTETAYKRLQAIKEFSEMGSGFKIAMRDLEIRGAGNLLGAEQSGHIEKIGYNLFVQLLSEAVDELQGKELKQKFDIKIETDISAYLSKDYIPSMSSRMAVYKQISSIQNLDDYHLFEKQISEIYGHIPEELINLAKISLIKNSFSMFGISKIVIKKLSKIVFIGKEYLTEKILDVMQNFKNMSINFTCEPTIEICGVEKSEILDYLIDFIQIFMKNC